MQFLKSENDTVWSTAVELAGLWKLESARANLETTLKQSESKQVKKNAAINSLIAMGGERRGNSLMSKFKTHSFLIHLKSP